MEAHQSMDEQFMTKVHEVIEQNIDNENFTVEELASHVGLSRSMLHRKLTKLTGKNASETISQIRLSRARELLEHNAATVSETAYRVGYKNPSYFNKVFKNYYHVSPGDLKREAKENHQSDLTDNSPGLNTINKQIHWLSHHRLIIASLVVLSCLTVLLTVGLHPFSAPPSLAVLPLENLTGSSDNDYLVCGLHDALIGELGRMSNLRVISRHSTLRYKETDMPLRNIAAELNVNNIIEGSVLSAGDSIHLLLQVIRTDKKESHIVTLDFHDELANILKIQTQVAQAVAQKVHANISRKELKNMNHPKAVNPDLYKSYLRGMYLLHQGNVDAFNEGIDYLEKAIETDPGDAFAYAGLALGYATMAHGVNDPDATFLKAFNAANKAIKLDPTLDESYTALSLLILYNDWNWPLALSSFESALETNPNNAVAHAHFAWYHILFNNKDKAIEHARMATLLDPLSPSYHAWLGLIYCYYNQFDNGEQCARRALDLNTDAAYANVILGWCCLSQKQYLQAITYYQRLPKGMYWDTFQIYCYNECGLKEKAKQIWLKYKEEAKQQPVNYCFLGMMAANLGYKEEAFHYLNQAVDNKVYPITYINFYPSTQPIRDDVRYSHLLQKMKLPYTEK